MSYTFDDIFPTIYLKYIRTIDNNVHVYKTITKIIFNQINVNFNNMLNIDAIEVNVNSLRQYIPKEEIKKEYSTNPELFYDKSYLRVISASGKYVIYHLDKIYKHRAMRDMPKDFKPTDFEGKSNPARNSFDGKILHLKDGKDYVTTDLTPEEEKEIKDPLEAVREVKLAAGDYRLANLLRLGAVKQDNPVQQFLFKSKSKSKTKKSKTKTKKSKTKTKKSKTKTKKSKTKTKKSKKSKSKNL